MFGAGQPVAQNFEKSLRAHFIRDVQILGEGADGAFVDFKEQSVFAAEMLEDRTLGDPQVSGNVTDARIVISMLGEMLGGGFNDARTLGFRAGPELGLALVKWRGDAIAGDSGHDNDF